MSDGVVVLVVLGAVILVALLPAAARAVRNRMRGAPPAVIVDGVSTTSHDWTTGAVQSAQTAEVLIPLAALEEIWSASNLERLARTYWRFLSRVTLGLVHVSYSEHERSIVLLFRPLKLLTFQAPEYEMDPLRGLVRWRIARGLLVARRGRDGRGYLQIEVRRR